MTMEPMTDAEVVRILGTDERVAEVDMRRIVMSLHEPARLAMACRLTDYNEAIEERTRILDQMEREHQARMAKWDAPRLRRNEQQRARRAAKKQQQQKA